VARLLVALALILSLPGTVRGQDPGPPAADTLPLPGVRGRLAAPDLTLRLPRAYTAPWLAGPRYVPSLAARRWDEAAARTADSLRAAAARNQLMLRLYGVDMAVEDSLALEQRQQGIFGLSRDLVDLTLDGTVRLEIRTDRLRNERCTPLALVDPTSGCRAGFNGPRIDNQLSIRSGGVIGRRLRLNVDWDTQRDFANTNNIQVYYEGLEDEMVRRVEVGTVAFRPPPSRFLTAAIPTNNFGVNAQFQFGAMDVQALVATQEGSTVAERTFTIGGTASQPQDRAQRDLDFENGRFFWVRDPRTLPGFPVIDPLTLDTLSIPPGERPIEVRVYRYRVPSGANTADPNLGGIPACGRQGSTPRTVGPVQWQLLLLGTDYYVDPSGLWVSLSQKVDLRVDFIAVSYRRQDGTLVGSFPDQPAPIPGTSCASVDSLLLVHEPLVGPEQPSFFHEIRSFYRIAGRDLELPSLQVSIAVNRSERPLDAQFQTYLAALGLAIPTDANVVDRENRVFPRARDPGADAVVRESYLVFPHLQPFADARRLQPSERQDSLYRTPIFLLFQQGPPSLFSLRLRYNSAGAGDRGTLNLNALQVREGTEQILLGGRVLERGVDYEIAYETGQVTFLNPDRLFGSGGAVTVTARFEERGVFAVAPTSIFGLTGRYDLGRLGAVNVMGLYQQEQSAFVRPQLGFEAAANLIAGANAELRFRPSGITRLLNNILPSRSLAESFLDFNAEVAFSKPDPNRSGEAYLEEFESESGIAITLRESAWEFGSVPQSADGLPASLGISIFERDDAVQLIWQNLIPAPGGGAVEFFGQDIDPNIQTAGRQTVPETVLYLTLHADTAGGVVQRNSSSRWTQPERPGRPRWRSMQTSVSPVGTDFTRTEFLEFWLYSDGTRQVDSAGVRLILDLGTVSEDALAVAPTTLTVAPDSVFTGRQYVGTGTLDTERRVNGIFNAETDDIGILGDVPTLQTPDGPIERFPLCAVTLTNAVPIFPWGDLSARCTRGNGFLSTEDLDGDNTLNARGSVDDVYRYVIDPSDPRYFVRNGVTDPVTGAGWRLYRVPVRDPAAVIGTPNLRLVQHVRVTFAAPDQGGPDRVARFALSRLRFVGSPWIRRADAPIAGLSGSTADAVGAIATAIVSTTDSTDLGYVSPPGVAAGVQRRDQVGGQLGAQINERALRIIAVQMQVGSRAEAFLRFPAGPQRFLGYRELRAWMRGRPGSPGWESGELEGFIKVGSDDRNFYLYRTPLQSAGGQEAWLPEIRVDLEKWRALRAVVEDRWLRGEGPSGADTCGGDPAAYVACEGPYMVHVGSPGVNPPNLSSVQEIAAGVLRTGGGASDTTEVWVNDIRLAKPVADVGVAYALEGRLAASDFADVSVIYQSVDGQFRQIGAQPSFRTTDGLSLASNVRLDRMLPTRLGLLMPLTLTYARSSVDPQLLTGTDIPGEALPGLRRPESNALQMGLVIRRSVRSANGLMRTFVDPLVLSASLGTGLAQTEFSRAENANRALSLSYSLTPQRTPRKFSLQGLYDALPGFLRRSDFGEGLRQPGVAWQPTSVRLQSGLAYDRGEFLAYAVPVRRETDAQVIPTLALTQVWRNAAGVTWQPLGMLSLSADWQSIRDLRDYGDTTDLARLASASRQSFLGFDVGVERDRTFATGLNLQPRIASWLRPRYVTSSVFNLNRFLNTRRVVREDADTAGAFLLPQSYSNSRLREIGVSVDYGRGLRQILGDSSRYAEAVRRFRPLDVSWRRTRGSTYDLATFDPSWAYQLALGGLGDFLRQGNTPALGVNETNITTATTGLEFSFGLAANVTYGETVTERYQFVNGEFLLTTVSQREWPSGNLRFTRSFRTGALALLTVGASLRERSGSTVQPSAAGASAITANESRAITPELQVSLRNGISLVSNLNLLDQRQVNNGNTTVLDQNDLSGTLGYGFRMPRLFGQRERRFARSAVTFLVTRAEQCLQRRDQPSCQVISDTRRQEFRGSLDTDILSTMTAGLQVGYTVNDLRHLDRKTSQIFFLVTFTLSLFAGDYR
jgi:hypothetical protein